MKKILSVLLVALMIFAMVPTVFAASTPVITTSVDKTNIDIDDIVTVTVKVSADSKLCALDYELYYSSSDFEVVEGSQSLKGVFGYEAAKDNTLSSSENVFKYSGTTSGTLTGSEAVLFTVQLRAKSTDGTIIGSVSGAYTSTGGNDYTNVLTSVAPASLKTITFKPKSLSYITLRTPSETTIRYKDGIVLHADVDRALPANSKIVWTTDNNNFTTTASSDGKSLTIVSKSKGTTNITATLYNASGIVIDVDTVTMTSKAGFFDKIIVFFRNLFGSKSVTLPE